MPLRLLFCRWRQLHATFPIVCAARWVLRKYFPSHAAFCQLSVLVSSSGCLFLPYVLILLHRFIWKQHLEISELIWMLMLVKVIGNSVRIFVERWHMFCKSLGDFYLILPAEIFCRKLHYLAVPNCTRSCN